MFKPGIDNVHVRVLGVEVEAEAASELGNHCVTLLRLVAAAAAAASLRLTLRNALQLYQICPSNIGIIYEGYRYQW